MEVKFGETHRWPCMYSIAIPEEEKVMYLTEAEVKDLMKQMKEKGF
jgi:hypothetical protein